MARLNAERPLDELERKLGFRFKDRLRFERAMTHASLRVPAGDASYERLEFLGDRVLGLVVSEKLFELFPKADEGELSLRFNALVSAETCSEIADELSLHEFIRHGGDLKRLKGERTRNIRADVVESLIAAIYLDGGLEAARRFILASWDKRFAVAAKARRDPKTALQEWAHTLGTETPRYEITAREGPDHDPTFTVRVSLSGRKPGEGRGRSRRLAEQEAATHMLKQEQIWKDDEA